MDVEQKPGLVHAAIVAIMAEGPTVAKDRRNQKQGYQFRGIDDFYEVLQPKLANHLVYIRPHRVIEDSMIERASAKEGGATIFHVRQRIEFRITHAQDGSWVPVETTGEGMDFGGDKATNKAMSTAMKYALMQTFCTPTGENADSENDSPEAGRRAPSRPTRPQRPPPGEPQAPPPEDEPRPFNEKPPLVDVNVRTEGGLWTTTGQEPRLRANQQARLKILQKELGVEDGPWREKLFAWCGKSSSADLSEREADEWAARLERSKAARAQRASAPT